MLKNAGIRKTNSKVPQNVQQHLTTLLNHLITLINHLEMTRYTLLFNEVPDRATALFLTPQGLDVLLDEDPSLGLSSNILKTKQN